MVTETTPQERRKTHLIETEELAERIAAGDPRLRVVDMRGYVRLTNQPDGVQMACYVGAEPDYRKGHIPGAVYFDWTRDIVDDLDPIPAQAAGAGKLTRTLEEAGIGDDSEIVAYDAHPASQLATRFWWLLRLYGHTNVRVLNGGWKKWTEEGRAASQDQPSYPPATFTPQPDPTWRTTARELLHDLGKPGITLIDARDEGQYTGRIRRGKRGGRIPGAKLLSREAFFTSSGTWSDPETLAKLIADNDLTPDKQVIAYCNGGVAATTALFALSMLGFPKLTNYDGSWNEWNLRDDLPIETD